MSKPSTWGEYASWLVSRGWVFIRNGKKHAIYQAPNGRKMTVSFAKQGRIDRNALANAKRLEREEKRC